MMGAAVAREEDGRRGMTGGVARSATGEDSRWLAPGKWREHPHAGKNGLG